MTGASHRTMTLIELNRLIASLVACNATQCVWVTAELSDVAVRGGHCYMELIQKDDTGNTIIAKARGIIWANRFSYIAAEFMAATGQRFATGLKVMVRVSANFHPVFGLSLVIDAVNPDYTIGDLMRKRQEILRRLEAEGILNDNRNLTWCAIPNRIAIISAPGAAGYGDFINQLYNNPLRLRFKVKLFEAIMQGENAPASIINALERIVMDPEEWDGVVIIRGGGATSDLACFDNYDIAANIAQFPLPVIIGIGHERDITVLDYVANMRVKTPTAAAEWFIARGNDALDRLTEIAVTIHRVASEKIAASGQQLAYSASMLSILPLRQIERSRQTLTRHGIGLSQLSSTRLAPELGRLQKLQNMIGSCTSFTMRRHSDTLDSYRKLLDVLSPQATLERGYSITMANGRAVRDPASVPPGSTITTILAKGKITSAVTDAHN